MKEKVHMRVVNSSIIINGINKKREERMGDRKRNQLIICNIYPSRNSEARYFLANSWINQYWNNNKEEGRRVTSFKKENFFEFIWNKIRKSFRFLSFFFYRIESIFWFYSTIKSDPWLPFIWDIMWMALVLNLMSQNYIYNIKTNKGNVNEIKKGIAPHDQINQENQIFSFVQIDSEISN